MQSYFNNRKQYVELHNYRSQHLDRTGFNTLNVNHICDSIDNFKYVLSVDDSTIFRSGDKLNPSLCPVRSAVVCMFIYLSTDANMYMCMSAQSHRAVVKYLINYLRCRKRAAL